MSYSKELEMANFNQTQGMGFNGSSQEAPFNNPHMLDKPFVGPMPNKTEEYAHQVPLPNHAQCGATELSQRQAATPQGVSQPRSADVSEPHVNARPHSPVNGCPDSRSGGHMHYPYGAQDTQQRNASYSAQEHVQHSGGFEAQGQVQRSGGYDSQEQVQRNGGYGHLDRNDRYEAHAPSPSAAVQNYGQPRAQRARGAHQGFSGEPQMLGGAYQCNNKQRAELSYARSGGAQASRYSNQHNNYSQPLSGYKQPNNQTIQRNFEPQGNNTMQQYSSNPYNVMQQAHSYDRRGFQSNVPFHGTMPQQPMQQAMPQQDWVQQGMAQQGMPQQSVAQYGMPEQANVNQGIPQQGMPQHGVAQYGMPQQANVNQGMPQHGMPQQGVAQCGMPQQANVHQGISQQSVAHQEMPQQRMGIRSEPLPKALQANHAADRPVAAPKQMTATAPLSTSNEHSGPHGLELRQQPQSQSLAQAQVAGDAKTPKAPALMQAQSNGASMQQGTQAPAVATVAHGASTHTLASQQEGTLVVASATSAAAPCTASTKEADKAALADVAKLDAAASQVDHAVALAPAAKQDASSKDNSDAPQSTNFAPQSTACAPQSTACAPQSTVCASQSTGCAAAKAACEGKVAQLSALTSDELKQVGNTDEACTTAVAADVAASSAQGVACVSAATASSSEAVAARANAKVEEAQIAVSSAPVQKVSAKAAEVKAQGDPVTKAEVKVTVRGKSQAKSSLEESKVPNFFAKASVQVSSTSKLEDGANEPKLIDSRIAFEMLDSNLPPVSVPFHAAEVMGNVPMKDHKYVFQPDMLKSVLMFLNNPGNDSLFISGPSGCGKTSAVLEIAARLNWPIESVTLSQRTEVCDLIGRNVLRHGELHYEYGPLAKAMLYGEILLLNEIDLLSPGELAALNDVIEGKTLTVISNMGEKLYAHPGFRIIATANSKGNGDATGFYQGVCYQNQAFLDRWEFLECDYANNKQALQMITTVFSTINPDFAKLLIRFSNVIRYGTASPRGNHHDTVLTTYKTYDSLLSEQNGNRTLAYDLLTEEMPDIADALRRSLRAQQDAQVGEAEKDVGVIDADYLDYLRVKREEILTERYLDKTAGSDAKAVVDAAICQNKDLVASAGGVDPSEVKKPNILQIIDSLNDLMVGRALSNTLHDRSFSFRSHISAPLTDRALLRICRFYVTYPQMSVEECINAGFGSRLNADEFELVMRLTYDVFGYGSGINELPHNTDLNEKYMQLRARYPKIVSAVDRAEEAMLSREEFFIMKRKKLAELDQKMAEIASKDYRIVHPSNKEKNAANAASAAQISTPVEAHIPTSDEAHIPTSSEAQGPTYVEAQGLTSVEASSKELDGSDSAAVCEVTNAVDTAASASLGEVASGDVLEAAVLSSDASAATHPEQSQSGAVKGKASKPKRTRKNTAKASSADSASEAAPTKRKRSSSKAKAVGSAKELEESSATDLLGAISSDEDTSAEQASA